MTALKPFAGFLLALLLPFMAAAEKAPEPDIRSFSWGTSSKEVIKNEKAEVFKSQGETPVLFKDKLLNLEVVFGYMFVKDRLQGAAFTFKEKRANKNDYLSDFDKVSTWLTEKYGKPNHELREWDNEESKKLYAKDKSKWGEALGFDHMRQSSEWATPRTYVQHSLSNVNSEIVHVIAFSYASKDPLPEPAPPEKTKKPTKKKPKVKKETAPEISAETPKEDPAKVESPKQEPAKP